MTSKSDLIPQTSNSTAIALNGGVDPFLAYADAISPRSIVGTLLKFSKGDYLAGEEGEIIPHGTQLTANCDEFLAGWIKWQDGKPVEQRMIRVADGFHPPVRTDLGDTDKSLWETDDKGEPKDPWQFTNYLLLMDAMLTAICSRSPRHRVAALEAGCSEDQAAAITGHRDLNVLRGYVREANRAKLARQAIRKQEAAG